MALKGLLVSQGAEGLNVFIWKEKEVETETELRSK